MDQTTTTTTTTAASALPLELGIHTDKETIVAEYDKVKGVYDETHENKCMEFINNRVAYDKVMKHMRKLYMLVLSSSLLSAFCDFRNHCWEHNDEIPCNSYADCVEVVVVHSLLAMIKMLNECQSLVNDLCHRMDAMRNKIHDYTSFKYQCDEIPRLQTISFPGHGASGWSAYSRLHVLWIKILCPLVQRRNQLEKAIVWYKSITEMWLTQQQTEKALTRRF